jgi:hopene-associated glycosyltransferase HpnB
VGEDGEPPEPSRWPGVAVLVPARNEARTLPVTLPALLAQEYPGEWRIVVVDDRSGDGTGEAALAAGGARITLVRGADLPRGWVGKVWALAQARAALGSEPPEYLLLTDADIRHAPGSLRRLVAESEAAGLALSSRMARLRCHAGWERLLLPAFVFFFNLLYPMRQANDPSDRLAAAAGGCLLVRTDALERAGAFESIRAEPIDDVNLARRVKGLGAPIRLALSRSDVVSVRAHESLASVWRMVRRTAFDELRYSWARVGAALTALALLFGLPPLLVAGGAALRSPPVALSGLAAWALSALAYLPTVRFYELRAAWAASLPLAGVLYGGMTLDSAVRHRRATRAADLSPPPARGA